jgi:PPOX class probable F420-dependent enzyme
VHGRETLVLRELPEVSKAIKAKLSKASVARLATLDSENKPHIVPVCFAYDGRVFYSAVDRKPKRVAPERLARLQNIRARPHVTLLIDEYDEDWTKLWYILIRGKCDLLSLDEERKRALDLLRKKYPQYASRELLPEDAQVIRIAPERIVSWGRL